MPSTPRRASRHCPSFWLRSVVVPSACCCTDQNSPALQKAVARLKDLGPGAIEPVFAALPEASKTATIGEVKTKTPTAVARAPKAGKIREKFTSIEDMLAVLPAK